MLVHAVDGQVQKFPYTLADLRLAHPQLSIPDSITNQELATFGVYPVQAATRPAFDNKTHRLRQSAENSSGAWRQVWSIEQLPEPQAAANVRNYRNQLLFSCDWTQLPDAPVDQTAWAAYRQALRDVTEQPNFPWDVEWPLQP